MRQGEVSALVHSLTLGVVYVPSCELQAFKEELRSSANGGEGELKNSLVSQGMLVVNDVDDEENFIRLRDQLRSKMSLEMMYLLVTDGCNLRCTYCFEESPSVSGSFRAMHMSEEAVVKSLDLFASMTARYGNPQLEKVIHLYGGEPLANRKAVYRAVSYANELKARGSLPDSCRLVIVTNGVLLNEEDAQFFSANAVSVGLSIDGPAFITNLYRVPKRSGINVAERITHAFRLLKKHGVGVGLSVTLTPEAVDHFDEFLAFFTEGEFRAADGASLNLLHYTPHVKLSDDFYRKAVECQIKAFQRFREIGFYEDRIIRKVSAFVDQEPMYADCGVVGRQLVIAPDGRIGVCQDFVKTRTYFPRSVYDTDHDDLLDVLFENWRNRSPFFMTQCTDCPALGICGGGCPASAELKTGDKNNIDERACFHSKRVLEWLVWDAYAAAR